MAEVMTERSTKTAMGGSVLEIIAGIGAAVLAIIGLLNIAPLTMASLATILVGAALMFEGATLGSQMGEGARRDRSTVGGTSVEVIGGITGVVLGVLALLRITGSPFVLTAAAAIVFGASLILGSAGIARLSRGAHLEVPDEDAHRVARTERAASGTELLVGIGAVALGILALLGVAREPLSLIALLAVGVSVLLSGSAMSFHLAKMMGRSGSHDRREPPPEPRRV
jgi:hypothetical protein